MGDTTDASKQKEKDVIDSVSKINKKLDIIQANIEKLIKNQNHLLKLYKKYFKDFSSMEENKPGIPRS